MIEKISKTHLDMSESPPRVEIEKSFERVLELTLKSTILWGWKM